MIISQVCFHLKEPISLQAATEVFESTAPKYQGRTGLQRKYYIRSEDGLTVGGLYFWESREYAQQTYSDEWRAMVSEKYGASPEITYFDAPVMVDNS